MNIAQELSIVRDNIAEYGMTNITQLEYDAIYQQGRAEFEPLINLLVSMETDVICEEMSTTDYCEQNCKYDCPQKKCYLRYLEYVKEQKNDKSI